MWIIPLVFPVEKVGKTLLTLFTSYPQYFTVFMHVLIRVKTKITSSVCLVLIPAFSTVGYGSFPE